MPSKDLFNHPFSEETITKLEIFEKYAETWLPVFLFRNFKDIFICDFFSGAGYDKIGAPGSPLRILEVIKNQQYNIIKNGVRINLLFNELDKEKYFLLEKNITEKLEEMPDLKRHLKVQIENEEFYKLFEKRKADFAKSANLFFLDQNGVKEISSEVFFDLINYSTTDFMFFISSSFFHRFQNEGSKIFKEFNLHDIKGYTYSKVHKAILELYKKMIPEGNSTKLYPFSIKKGANIYGLIFGAKHPRAVDNFLRIVWDKNKLNGQANFDMDKENKNIQRDFFTDQGQTKIEKYEFELEKFILSKNEITNKDLYDFTLENGHIPKHTVDKVRAMKKKNIIAYDGHPCISYDKCYSERKKEVKTFEVIGNEKN